MTIKETLERASARLKRAGIAEARLEAESLFAHATGRDSSRILAHPEASVRAAATNRFQKMVSARGRRRPFAYVTGVKSFYGREFLVTPDVLIPRPETETLIEAAVAGVREQGSGHRGLGSGVWDQGTGIRAQEAEIDILDIGTGSGAIGLTLVAELPGATACVLDVSKKALLVARKNARRLGVTKRVRFLMLDILKRSPAPKRPEGLLVLAANLPYLSEARMKRVSPEVRREPSLALVSGRDGLRHYRALAARLREWRLTPDVFVLEAEPEQMPKLEKLFRPVLPDTRFTCIKDLFGDNRVLMAEKKKARV